MGIFDKAKDLLRGHGKGAGKPTGDETVDHEPGTAPETPATQAGTAGLTEPLDDRQPGANPPAAQATRPADEELATQAGSAEEVDPSADAARPEDADLATQAGTVGATDSDPDPEVSDADAGAEGDMPAPEGDFRPTAGE